MRKLRKIGAILLIGLAAIAVFTACGDDVSGNDAQTTAQQTPGVLDAGIQNPFSQVSGGACQPGDKIGTWSEIQGAGPQRIEVGGHGGQHLDFYPAPGVKSVSYVVSTIANPDGTPSLALGFGSLWEWNPPGCAYDYVADATAYARARLDSGHSGLVVDLRSSPPQVVANVANMSQDAINSLLTQHSAAMEANGKAFRLDIQAGTTPSQPVAVANRADCNAIRGKEYLSVEERAWFLANCIVQSAPQAQPQQPVSEPAASSLNCDTATAQETHVPVVGQGWVPSGEWRVVNFWTNEPGQDQAERKILLAPGDNTALMGGGTSWSWPAACADAARKAYDQNSLPPR